MSANQPRFPVYQSRQLGRGSRSSLSGHVSDQLLQNYDDGCQNWCSGDTCHQHYLTACVLPMLASGAAAMAHAAPKFPGLPQSGWLCGKGGWWKGGGAGGELAWLQRVCKPGGIKDLLCGTFSKVDVRDWPRATRTHQGAGGAQGPVDLRDLNPRSNTAPGSKAHTSHPSLSPTLCGLEDWTKVGGR